MDMLQRPGILKYKNWRYLKMSWWIVLLASAIYFFHQPAEGEAYGGTWLGYTLGIVSLLLVLLLMWYGMAKRNVPRKPDRRQYNKVDRRKLEKKEQSKLYKRRDEDRRQIHPRDTWRFGGSLQGWLSAHVSLGASLIVLATLHSGFQFGWNIHTVSYVLMLVVIASGFYGMYVYVNYPRLITENMGGDSLENIIEKIAELDESARLRALGLPDEINEMILIARTQTQLGGNLLQQLSGNSGNDCPTKQAIKKLLDLGPIYTKDDQPKLMRDLYAVLLRKDKLVQRARNEIMLKARMQFWLYLHAPLSIALLAALFTHVVSVFYYW